MNKFNFESEVENNFSKILEIELKNSETFWILTKSIIFSKQTEN